MTTANFLNISAVKGPQVDVSKKLQEEAREVTEIFASMMNQTIDVTEPMVTDDAENVIQTDVKANGSTSAAESYERYNYKERQIETAKNEGISEQDAEVIEEQLEAVEEEILDILCEEYGVDQDTLKSLMDEMGLTVLDLLNPQNLVSFLVELMGVTAEELLLDENFLKIMEMCDDLGESLEKDLGVDAEGLRELLAEMDAVEEVTEFSSFGEIECNKSGYEYVTGEVFAKICSMVEYPSLPQSNQTNKN